MRGEDGADAVDDFAAVSFEGVRGVVEAMAEEEANEEVRGAVEGELEGWVVDHAAVLEEAAAEDAVVPFIELFPITDDIAAVIGFIGHHDDHSIACHGIQPADDGAAETVGTGVFNGAEGGDFCGFGLEDLPSGIGGAVVHHDDFMWDAAEGKFEVEVLDGGGDAALLVPRRYYYRKE